jgi:hypothetical protein
VEDEFWTRKCLSVIGAVTTDGRGFGSFGCGRGSAGYYERKSTPVDVEKLSAKKCKVKAPIEVEIDTSGGEVLGVCVSSRGAPRALELPFGGGEETTRITKSGLGEEYHCERYKNSCQGSWCLLQASPATPEWWNWQTRWTQNPVHESV